MFTTKEEYVFLGTRQYQKTPQSNVLNFVTLGSIGKFENYDFLVLSDQVNLNQFSQGDKVSPTFELNKFENRASFSLVGLSPVAVATK